MEIKCQRCGAPAASEQAFCAKCGAVIGMGDAGRDDAPPNLAATLLGKKRRAAAPAPRPAPPRPAAAGSARGGTAPASHTSRGNKTLILAVIGFMVVLLVGSLFVLLFLFGTD
jgi:hypothetical protein